MLLFIPFLALDDKGGVKGHLCTHLGMCRPCIPLFRTHVILFMFWTSLILCKDYVVWETCIVCYSVFSYRTWVYSKKILLVCVLIELTDCCFFCVLAQKSRILRDTGRILRIFCPESLGFYPEYPGPAAKTHFYWVDNMSYASLMFLHAPVHPTIKHIRVFVVLVIYMPIVDMSSQNWNSKFMAYIKGELLYARCLLFYVNQMSYMWVVINHQKGGDWKWSRPQSGFWWLMAKHMYI